MTDASAELESVPNEKTASRGKLPLIFGLFLALIGAAGGFAAVRTGVIPALGNMTEKTSTPDSDAHADPDKDLLVGRPLDISEIEFVALDPIHLSLGTGAERRQLRFQAQVEVVKSSVSDVQKLKPRITDVLNGYLRAIAPGDLESPAALIRLRAQMLRRINIVTGQGRVRDLLIMEFVLN